MKPFGYHRPLRVQEALFTLGPGVRPLAGGTDLVPGMRRDVFEPDALVDLKRTGLPDGITVGDDGAIRIGALATLAQLERDERLHAGYALLAEAVRDAASPQIRNRATVAGNLLQRPRCGYFRGAPSPCWLRGGDTCFARDGVNDEHAILGDGPCVAVHPSDLAPCLLAAGATLEVVSTAGGAEDLPISALYAPPEAARRSEHTLDERTLIAAVRLPRAAPGTRGTYVKVMPRRAWSFALASVAVLVERDGEHVRRAAVVLGGVANVPWRLPAVEDLLIGAAPDAGLVARAADAAVAGAQPLAGNGYKVELVRRIVHRALGRVTGVGVC